MFEDDTQLDSLEKFTTGHVMTVTMTVAAMPFIVLPLQFVPTSLYPTVDTRCNRFSAVYLATKNVLCSIIQLNIIFSISIDLKQLIQCEFFIARLSNSSV